MLLGKTVITFSPWRQIRKNFLTERLENVPKEIVISPSSYFGEGGISQMTVLSLSSSFVVNLQWLRRQKSEAQNALTILFFSPFIFSYSCQKKMYHFCFSQTVLLISLEWPVCIKGWIKEQNWTPNGLLRALCSWVILCSNSFSNATTGSLSSKRLVTIGLVQRFPTLFISGSLSSKSTMSRR